MKIRAALIVLLLTCAAPARAAIWQQFESWSVATGTSGLDLFAFDPFDTSLGTLDRVTLGLQGTVVMFSPATANLLPIGPFGSLLPAGYNYQIGMRLDLFGLIGFDFDFNPDAQFVFSGQTPGTGEPLTGVRQFSIVAELDALSDSLGFVLPQTFGVDQPPVTINGSRGEFEEDLLNAATGLQLQMLNIWSVIFETGTTAVITPMGSSSGLVTLSYDYTPFDEPIPEVPLPGAMWLFGTALAGLGVARRRKKTA